MEEERKERQKRILELEKKLKTKEIRFCRELLSDDNGTAAAIRAGYSEKSARQAAYKLLQREEIVEYKILIAKEAYEKIGIVPEVIALQIHEILQRCMQKKPVMEWDPDSREYVETGTWTFDAKNALGAAKLMGESVGMFQKKPTDAKGKKQEITVDVASADPNQTKEESK